ncbi:MAG: glycosyltransferase family 2 protein [Deltaproteobacteria bacterium]|nr:glycosyltransferase family 2 protein [Deltaproteobacteria bacterium]
MAKKRHQPPETGPGIELSIIIVNWHSAAFLRPCLETIREQTTRIRYEVIVVDNASFDGCGERLAEEDPTVRFIQSQENLGFARANNLGARQARGPVLLFLNPDTEVRDRALEHLWERVNTLPRAGAVGCRLLNSDGSLQTSCVQSFPTIVNQMLDADILRKISPRSGLWGTAGFFEPSGNPVPVEAVSGACLMIPREIFDRVGGFSSEYFMYGEDLDLCYKVSRQGRDNYYCGAVAVVHHGGGSSRQAPSRFAIQMLRESVQRFLTKFHGPFYGGVYRLTMSGAALTRLILLLVLTPVFVVRGRTAGWQAALQKWWAVLHWGLGLARSPRRRPAAGKGNLQPPRDLNGSCAESAEN